ncbi:LLM class flavin-dependent oxidoreductase [Desertimonas flava]|uniref:LLM class flavin-dependent oxidoreductase n=1 Tax=Desertimonas flava TaxID=2064846 RepID=UPI000E3461D3|nr:LLM class flavin-dependent oxidoreductase [Desertimonas flava]
MRFDGMLIPAFGWPDLVERARQLERLGFGTVWIDDHIANPVAVGAPWFEAWAALAGLAASTETIRIGPMAGNVVLRHPTLLARQAITVDHASGGRLSLTIGSGYAEPDHALVQTPMWDDDERQGRFRDAVVLLDCVLRGDQAPASDDSVWVDEPFQIRPRSKQSPRPPLIVAAHGPKAIELAGERGDGWCSYGGYGLGAAGVEAITRQRVAMLEDAAVRHGRDPGSIERLMLVGNTAVSDEPMWASTDAFEDLVGRYTEVGITTLVLYNPPSVVAPGIDDSVVEAVFEEVVPRLMALHTAGTSS